MTSLGSAGDAVGGRIRMLYRVECTAGTDRSGLESRARQGWEMQSGTMLCEFSVTGAEDQAGWQIRGRVYVSCLLQRLGGEMANYYYFHVGITTCRVLGRA